MCIIRVLGRTGRMCIRPKCYFLPLQDFDVTLLPFAFQPLNKGFLKVTSNVTSCYLVTFSCNRMLPFSPLMLPFRMAIQGHQIFV
nr:MAG TPA: hypothetical protein [Caudoviricetes sp.]